MAVHLCLKEKKSIGGFTVGNTFSMCQQCHPAAKKDKHHTVIYKENYNLQKIEESLL